jgi:hypothetical protein
VSSLSPLERVMTSATQVVLMCWTSSCGEDCDFRASRLSAGSFESAAVQRIIGKR